MNIIHLPPASPSEGLRALQEVKDFATTDMGWGGPKRWTFRVLSDEQITPEIARLSHPHTHGPVDSVTFQPCQTFEARSQDRRVVQSWDLPGGRWTFSGIFDGHCSHETVDYVADCLPPIVRDALQQTLSRGPANYAKISEVLHNSIVHLDNSITSQFLKLFPAGPHGISQLSDSQLRAIIQEPNRNSPNYMKALRCMRGSTALITLTDPRGENLWVANLGDCLAVLVSRRRDGSWRGRCINEVHNGGNDKELRRIVNEHPGEKECVLDRRVIGYLAPTRAVGDTWMKLPGMFSRRIFKKMRSRHPLDLADDFIDRIRTPPYISNIPDVYHRRLRRSHGEEYLDKALILCSDGLTDLYDGRIAEDVINRWARVIGDGMTDHSRKRRGSSNLAMRLLRDAIGGDDLIKVSRNLTVEMDERWMDDTTILVQKFS
ncbi:protein serine/threonine phosphatase 2C [Rickenella mellea]|uniref:Protein serine/threonine phosphatase 2C n=1 Tax=Rickenella mellea TaxID=50990 RepID=A0A4Y7Q9D6_9AGAM|nr:protein serine/threonine phosphatase 2C [Rickenella mellea]